MNNKKLRLALLAVCLVGTLACVTVSVPPAPVVVTVVVTAPLVITTEVNTTNESAAETVVATATLTPTVTSAPTLLPTHTPYPTQAPLPTYAPQPTLPPPPAPTSPPPAPVCDCSYNRYNCANFSTQSQAQACYNYCRSIGAGDVHRLDADSDGWACEALP